jgi:hypothetical protein
MESIAVPNLKKGWRAAMKRAISSWLTIGLIKSSHNHLAYSSAQSGQW